MKRLILIAVVAFGSCKQVNSDLGSIAADQWYSCHGEKEVLGKDKKIVKKKMDSWFKLDVTSYSGEFVQHLEGSTVGAFVAFGPYTKRWNVLAEDDFSIFDLAYPHVIQYEDGKFYLDDLKTKINCVKSEKPQYL